MGDEVNITFSILDASPPVQLEDIHWFYRPLLDISDSCINITGRSLLEDGKTTLTFSPDQLSLTVGNLHAASSGFYYISAFNGFGVTAAGIYRIEVQRKTAAD